MTANWLVARRLCLEKLNLTEITRVLDTEIDKHRMLGGNEIIRMYWKKLKFLRKINMPENSNDLFYDIMIPCAPKVTIEIYGGKKNIGGSDILQYFDSYNIVNILHRWDEKLNTAEKRLWDSADFPKKMEKSMRDELGD